MGYGVARIIAVLGECLPDILKNISHPFFREYFRDPPGYAR